MRRFAASLVLALGVLASAQTVQHVVVVVQENRTPDNLFGADSALAANGANLWNLSQPAPCVLKGKSSPTVLQPFQLDACFDPIHSHSAWTTTYNNGKMDQACAVTPANSTCAPNLTYANYSYVDNSQHIVDPYFNIAANYGFANYMFQTNQGPSFPAHLFLFSGTSAPVSDDSDPQNYWQWFAAENPARTSVTGCTAPLGQIVPEIDPKGKESAGYTPPYPAGAGPGFPCYTHNTLADLLDGAGLSWKYYTPYFPYTIWTAPAAMSSICGIVVNGACTGQEWTNHVVIPTSTDNSPILTDIQSCNLPAVSWVIPDGRWSDHPGTVGENAGPSFVAAIVNAIGGANQFGNTNCPYWPNTVILITWDDWGGFYDHVSPSTAAGGPGIGYSNQTGQQYVYGFRVPLLVVSAYAKQGYISGPPSNPVCPSYYCHDFGSILGFIEHSFGLGEIYPTYHYADYFAPDGTNACPTCFYPLADFFGTFFNPFVAINGAKYQPSCFITPKNCSPGSRPSLPDNDMDDD